MGLKYILGLEKKQTPKRWNSKEMELESVVGASKTVLLYPLLWKIRKKYKVINGKARNSIPNLVNKKKLSEHHNRDSLLGWLTSSQLRSRGGGVVVMITFCKCVEISEILLMRIFLRCSFQYFLTPNSYGKFIALNCITCRIIQRNQNYGSRSLFVVKLPKKDRFPLKTSPFQHRRKAVHF